jgi:Zn-dependent protease
MDRSLRLGTVAGVRVHAHWSLLVIALLLAASLARAFRPEVGGAAAAWFGGLLAAVLFFASILAHELAHAAAARRAGVRVERVTLWLFGGMAHLDDAAPTPGSQLRIALAGPRARVV